MARCANVCGNIRNSATCAWRYASMPLGQFVRELLHPQALVGGVVRARIEMLQVRLDFGIRGVQAGRLSPTDGVGTTKL